MKTKGWMSFMAAGSIALSSVLFGQTAEMTGKVVAVTKDAISVQTDNGVWQIARGTDTKVTGDLKVGGTVTIHYNASDAQKKEGVN
ncbi:MAG: hypothetical protein ABI540_03530 [Spartobacteria bacterium]